MIKLLIGGSPCTRWSIAQTKNRETEPSGIGWELFENYLIALEKFRPDFFLYENNKSMSKAIRDEITRRFGFEPICINSSKLSAQNRQRLYWCGKRNPDGTYSRVDVEQPEDRGILLRDILETGTSYLETTTSHKPIRVGTFPNSKGELKGGQGQRIYGVDAKGINLTANGGGQGAKTGLYAISFSDKKIGVFPNENGELTQCQSKRIYSIDAKGRVLNAGPGGLGVQTGLYAVPCESMAEEYYKGGFDGNLIGMIENESVCRNGNQPSQQYRIYSCDGKSVCVDTDQRKHYIVPCAGRVVGRRINESGHRDDYNPDIPHIQRFEVNENPQKTNCLTTVQKDNMVAVTQEYDVYQESGFTATGETVEKTKLTPVYEVRNGLITIKGKRYPIKLADGFYIIRKLTVTECKRLQTVPDSYVFPVSDTQAYKMLGNGWTVDVITHILSHCQGITDEPLDVLSMYDGMACGHIALDKLGAQIARYRATEIDKYAIKTACHNFPDIIQLGDAFQVREWE